MYDQLWADDPVMRLQSAKELSEREVRQIQEFTAAEAPMRPWPFGMATVANPYIVFLGPSPGNSPASDDPDDVPQAISTPTVGHPHERMDYKDSAGYWDAIRAATKIAVRAKSPQLSDRDCISLMGKMNLGVGQFGTATKEVLEDEYLQWTPRVIATRLRPKFLVIVGMKTLLKQDKAFQRTIGQGLGVDFTNPDLTEPFTYADSKGKTKKLNYQLWAAEWHSEVNVRATVVLWPQHPSRPPFKSNPTAWENSVQRLMEMDFVRARL